MRYLPGTDSLAPGMHVEVPENAVTRGRRSANDRHLHETELGGAARRGSGRTSCSRCGQTGHNVNTCSRRGHAREEDTHRTLPASLGTSSVMGSGAGSGAGHGGVVDGERELLALLGLPPLLSVPEPPHEEGARGSHSLAVHAAVPPLTALNPNVAFEPAAKRPRRCKLCKEFGHYQKTCPRAESNEGSVAANAAMATGPAASGVVGGGTGPSGAALD